jgi:hypothetical protein
VDNRVALQVDAAWAHFLGSGGDALRHDRGGLA